MNFRVPRALVAAIVLAALAFVPACSRQKNVVPTGILEGDKYLMDRGTELIAKKKWFQAREYFRQLVDNYPQSNYRPDAKLGVGDTYLGERSPESLVLAQNEYREFLTFYPTHARADYAQFKLGMSYFLQMLAADRDQTSTKEAVAELACVHPTLSAERAPRRRPPEVARRAEPPERVRVQGRVLLLAEQVVSGRDRALQVAVEDRPRVPHARRGLLLPWRLAGEDGPPRRSGALLRSAGEGIREERIPGEGAVCPEGSRWKRPSRRSSRPARTRRARKARRARKRRRHGSGVARAYFR